MPLAPNPFRLTSLIYMKTKGLHRAESSGFSIIEILVYISILVFMLAIILEVVVSVTRRERIATSTRDIENSAVLVAERITRETRQAQSINLSSSILGVHPGKLVLDGESRTLEFHLINGRINLKENGVDAGPLTSSTTKVTNLKFTRSATSTTEAIRTELTLESGTSTYYKTETFYFSSSIR